MILVTGAEGFIGRAVCARLAELGFDFLGVDRRFPAPIPGAAAEGDLCDPAFVASLFDAHRFRAVVHLASPDPVIASRKNEGHASAISQGR